VFGQRRGSRFSPSWRRLANCAAAAVVTLYAGQVEGQTVTTSPQAAAVGPTPTGSSEQTADLDGTALQVFTYRPADCTVSGALLVFHGLSRNVADYRDNGIPLAQRYCLLVVAPLFDEVRFPIWSYQRGGIIRDGKVQPSQDWTVNLAARLATWVRTREDRVDLPFVLIGHSAGGQFLSRVAAFSANEATQTVIANPSTWVRPSPDIAAPYGFGAVFAPPQDEMALRRYLAARIIVLLGQEDVGSRNLANGEEAKEQGGTRLERGQNVFREAEAAARQRGWPFNWRLSIVPGIGHNAREMFSSTQIFEALHP
jgi:poly(3-hydroxybutyrate) depolymerase